MLLIENLAGTRQKFKKDRGRKMIALRKKMKEDKHLGIYGGVREDIGIKTCTAQ